MAVNTKTGTSKKFQDYGKIRHRRHAWSFFYFWWASNLDNNNGYFWKFSLFFHCFGKEN